MADPMTILSILSTIGGGLGTIFGSGDDETERLLKKRLKGIDPKTLAAMKREIARATGNEASALRTQASQRLGRQDAPVAKQEEVMDKVTTRGLGARASAYTELAEMNERYKQGAMSDLANFSAMSNQGRGQGYAAMFGSGLNYLMNRPPAEEMQRMNLPLRKPESFRFDMPNNWNFRSSFGGF